MGELVYIQIQKIVLDFSGDISYYNEILHSFRILFLHIRDNRYGVILLDLKGKEGS